MSQVNTFKTKLIGICAVFMLVSPAYASQEDAGEPIESPASTQKIVGYSLLIGGGVVTWLGVFAGATGGDRCSEKAKRSDETAEQCRERVSEDSKEDSKKMMRLKLALIGVGLAGVGTGLYLVKTAPEEVPQAGLFFDGTNFGLTASISF